ncbi:uncharacterized protein [Nicotiana sylvestris]|uniref:uncharacterized protein n=1 Tax=Nicotiana sylvestris TaxID=4096 RepID=UPI00388C3673
MAFENESSEYDSIFAFTVKFDDEEDKKEDEAGVRGSNQKYLLSVSQTCEKGNEVKFLSKSCIVTNLKTSELVLIAKMFKNICIADFDLLNGGDLTCLSVIDDDAELWHRRLGCKLYLAEQVDQEGLGPMRVPSRVGKKYIFVIVNDYSRFTWTLFLKTKDETFLTPQQNGFMERENRTLEDMARTMLIDIDVPKSFWAEVVNIACYLINSDEEDAIEPPSFTKELDPSITSTEVEHRVIDDVSGTPNTGQRSGSHTSIDFNDDSDIQTRSKARNIFAFSAFLFQIEPKNIHEALKDADWITAMQEELHQFERNKVWHLVFRPSDKTMIGTRYFKEELFIKQPPGFETHEHPEHVFKLEKAIYGLKQAPQACYERLSKFLLENVFTRGKIDSALFLKKRRRNRLIVQVYVDDIICFATNDSLCEEFAKLMGSESVLTKPKRIHLKAAKRILRFLKGMQDLVLFYPLGNNFDLIGYVDYAGYFHKRTKHIDMRHHLLRDNIEKGLICVKFYKTEDQVNMHGRLRTKQMANDIAHLEVFAHIFKNLSRNSAHVTQTNITMYQQESQSPIMSEENTTLSLSKVISPY